jgi:hypothetical protein
VLIDVSGGVGCFQPDSRAAHPKASKGELFPGPLEPRRMADRAPTAMVQDAYVQGALIASSLGNMPTRRSADALGRVDRVRFGAVRGRKPM